MKMEIESGSSKNGPTGVDLDISAEDPKDIYERATECNILFRQWRLQIHGATWMLESAFNFSTKLIEEHEQRFWAWARGLGVFAEPFLSLDTKLKKHAQVSELVVMLLDILLVNLKEGMCCIEIS